MLLTRKLLDSFVDSLDAQAKKEIYELANTNFDEAIAKSALYYRKNFEDYPSGMVLDLIMQHLRDKVFQREMNNKAA